MSRNRQRPSAATARRRRGASAAPAAAPAVSAAVRAGDASRRALTLFGAASAAAVLVVAGCSKGEGSAPATGASAPAAAASAVRPVLTVSTVTAQPARWAQTVPANGSIAAWQEASIGAEGQGWRLAQVNVNVGDVVRKGQVLAVFASDVARADVAQLQASVAEAEARWADARADAARARELEPSGALSAQQIQQYRTAERTAAARVQAQRAAAKAQQVRLGQTTVVAPDDGVISARSATVGAVVPGGQELFRLIRQGRLEWRAELQADAMPKLKPGLVARLQPTGGAEIIGTVRSIAPTVNPTTRLGLVYVDLPRAALAGVKAGMFARGVIEMGEAAVQTLPQTAVVLRDGRSQVFVVEGDGRVRARVVRTGDTRGDRVQIESGLDAGAQVVASGAGFLDDGDRVRVVAAPNASAPASSAAPAASGAAR